MRRKEYIPQLPEVEQLRRELHRVRHRARYAAVLRSTVGFLLVTASVAVLTVTLWLPVLQIVGGSMAPTLEEGDIVVCVRRKEVRPGELVSFYLGNKLLVKRCIAMEGQTVEMDGAGAVLVDGQQLEEKYLAAPFRGVWEQESPCLVPEGSLFCLGDHRETSVDSRHAAVGFVTGEQICGVPWLRVWPLSRFGPVS